MHTRFFSSGSLPNKPVTLAIFSHYVTKQAAFEYNSLPPLEAMKRILSKPPRERPAKALEYLLTFTRSIRFFNELGEDAHFQCCQHMTYQFTRAGEYLFHMGDEGSQFFVVLDGKCSVMLPIREGSEHFSEVLEYGTGDSFGELAVIKNQPRAASILCKTDCHFAVLDREEFLRIIGKLKEMKLARKVEFLQNLPMFRSWTKGSLVKLSYYFKERTYRRKQLVFSVGDEAKEIYFIMKGEFQLLQSVRIPGSLNALQRRRGSTSMQAEVTVLSTGHVFGEEEVIENVSRRFTCSCRSESAEVLVLTKDDFTKRITNEETIRYLRKMNAKKAGFREERLKAITVLEELKKTVPSLTEPTPKSLETSQKSSVTLTPLKPKHEPTFATLSPLNKAPRYYSETQTPARRSPVNESKSDARTEPKHTWDQFLALKMEEKLRKHVRTRSDRVVNIHTEKQKQLWLQREMTPKVRSLQVPKAWSGSLSEVQLELNSFPGSQQGSDVRLKTILKKSPHHLFRVSWQGCC